MALFKYTSVFFILAIAGCNAVFVNAPFGDTVTKETVKSLEGTWSGGNENVFHVEPDGKGGIVVGKMQWNKDNSEFLAVNTPMSVRTGRAAETNQVRWAAATGCPSTRLGRKIRFAGNKTAFLYVLRP